MLFALVLTTTQDSEAAKKKKRYADWRGVASDMALEFNSAIDDVLADKYKDAYKHVNDAYFGYYEVQGFERTVMVAISQARVNHIEAQFSDIKHVLLGNQDREKSALLQQIEDLKIKVYKDAMVLDGICEISDPDSIGLAIYTDTQIPRPQLASAQTPAVSETPQTPAPPAEKMGLYDTVGEKFYGHANNSAAFAANQSITSISAKQIRRTARCSGC